jgi:hypothetical protein
VGKANDTVTRAEALEFERKLLSNPSFVTLSPSEQRGCLPAVLPSEDQKEIERALSRAITAAFRVIRTVHKTGSHRLDEAEVRKIAQDPLELLELFDFSDGVLIDEEIIFTTMDPNAINLHFHSEEGHLPLHPRRPSEDLTTSTSASSSASSPLPESYLTSKVGSVSSSEAVLDEQEILRLNHEKLVLLQKNAGEVHLELATLEAGASSLSFFLSPLPNLFVSHSPDLDSPILPFTFSCYLSITLTQRGGSQWLAPSQEHNRKQSNHPLGIPSLTSPLVSFISLRRWSWDHVRRPWLLGDSALVSRPMC